jgi:hypothetical protein
MDESGTRVGVVKWEEVVLYIDQKEIHTTSPQNRKSITIIESIYIRRRNTVHPYCDYLSWLPIYGELVP